MRHFLMDSDILLIDTQILLSLLLLKTLQKQPMLFSRNEKVTLREKIIYYEYYEV